MVEWLEFRFLRARNQVRNPLDDGKYERNLFAYVASSKPTAGSV